jgi:hypothetical protein
MSHPFNRLRKLFPDQLKPGPKDEHRLMIAHDNQSHPTSSLSRSECGTSLPHLHDLAVGLAHDQ